MWCGHAASALNPVIEAVTDNKCLDILAQSAGKENMVAQGKNTGYNDCGQEEREERKSKNKREKEGKSEYDKSLYL